MKSLRNARSHGKFEKLHERNAYSADSDVECDAIKPSCSTGQKFNKLKPVFHETAISEHVHCLAKERRSNCFEKS